MSEVSQEIDLMSGGLAKFSPAAPAREEKQEDVVWGCVEISQPVAWL